MDFDPHILEIELEFTVLYLLVLYEVDDREWAGTLI